MARKSAYKAILEHVFFARYEEGKESLAFAREDLVSAARAEGVSVPKNLGDVVYSFRYRAKNSGIDATAPEGKEWVIRGVGDGQYAFELAKVSRIVPNGALVTVKIPDATPEIIIGAARDDEQALLAKVRYNRLVDVFLGLTAYSIQNHLRTKVKGLGQVEVDEIYVAVDQNGCQYIVPVEAKGHDDELGIVQTEQDLAICKEKWGEYVPIPVAVQFLSSDTVAMFELVIRDGELKLAKEKHYQLVPSDEITSEDQTLYRSLTRQENQ